MRKLIIIIFLFIGIVAITFAQEYTVPVITSFKKAQTHKSTKAVSLPFFDDFSSNNLNTNLWQPTDAYLNKTFAIEPPSVGVVTFDAVDANGDFYENIGVNVPFSADILESQTIDLSAVQNVFLSFFYQSGANGDTPEATDTLMVEFFDNTNWNRVWYVSGKEITDFKQVMIEIQDMYLTDQFKFRFRNYASLSGTESPSLITNADHWHIDYIKLDANRSATDTIYHDIAFTSEISSFLQDYESVPWKHFKQWTSPEYKENTYIGYRNNDNQIRLIDTLSFIVSDDLGFIDNDTILAGAYNINESQSVFFDNNIGLVFNTHTADSASFRIKAKIATDGFDFTGNNEIEYVQEFKNFYSYDDGSAEKGYGIVGQGAQNAMVAVRFTPLVSDELTHIGMYFNKTYQNASQKYFYLTIWDDDNGQPGKIIYKKQGVKPIYTQNINQFIYYSIDSTLILGQPFYAGWIQTTDDLLNVGFDANRNNSSRSFYNINGQWRNSSKEGALMIRAVFADTASYTSVNRIDREIDANVYPNPASDKLFINLQKFHQTAICEIYNLQGKRIIRKELNSDKNQINTSQLVNGIYLIKIISEKKQIVKKIIIHK